MDICEHEVKRSGAYNANAHGAGPYRPLNSNDTLSSMFTFAHEAGHAMHSVRSNEHQPFATASCTIAVAKVASTMNERLLLDPLPTQTKDFKEPRCSTPTACNCSRMTTAMR